MSGWKNWQQLEVVTQADLQNFLQDQVVQVYTNATARTTALNGGVAATVGMVSYLTSTNSLEIYTTEGWVPVKQQVATSQNYIINGAFDIWQRGTSFATTSDQYTADRWYLDNRGGTTTVSQQAFTPADLSAVGFGEAQYYTKIEYDASNTDARFDQPIEDVRTLAGQTAILSFWAKSADEITITARAIQVFGSGGSSSVTTGLNDSVTLGTTWQRYTITGTINSISGKTIGAGSYLLTRFFSTATSAEFDIWGVQLEAGSVATPFKRHAPSLQGELAACQRYYYRLQSQAAYQQLFQAVSTSATALRGYVSHPVTMRSNPTFGVSGSFQTTTNVSVTPQSSENQAIYSILNFAGTGFTTSDGFIVRNNNDATAYVDFSSEL